MCVTILSEWFCTSLEISLKIKTSLKICMVDLRSKILPSLYDYKPVHQSKGELVSSFYSATIKDQKLLFESKKKIANA